MHINVLLRIRNVNILYELDSNAKEFALSQIV